MKAIRRNLLLVLVVLLALASCRRNKKANLTTVVQSDHFSSTTERFTVYNISDAEANKSVITTLRPKKVGDSYDNPITVKLSSGSEDATCKFSGYSDLCVLQTVKSLPPHMRIECEKLPCDAYFTNYQAPLIEPLESQKLDELYRLDSTSKHTILIFKCNDPDVKDYDSEVKIYSNQPFNRTYLNNMVFALFRSNNSKGYVYVETSDKVQTCTKMLSYKVSSKLGNLTKLKDFVDGGATNSYPLSEKPKDTDIRLDISIIGFDKSKPIKGTLKVELVGTDSGKETTITSYLIANPDNKTVLNINTIFKKQSIEKYSNLSVKVTSSSDLLMVNIEPEFTNVHEIDADELSVFTVEKGQTISYKLVKEDLTKGTAEVELLNDNGKIDLNKKFCNPGDECNIELTAKETVQQASLRIKLSDTVKQTYTPIKGSVSSRIRQGETQYFTCKVQPKKQAELTVNSENVVLYVGDSKCPMPSQSCNTYTGNYKEPIFIESEKELELFVAVVSLDDTRFTLRLMENTDDYIDLVDGEPFTYSLKEQKIGFTFRIKEKTDTQFNLISPMNTLNLYVSNSDKLPTGEQEDLKSTQGNILLKKEDLNGTTFSILVEKLAESSQKVSFTLIASTGKAIFPLEPAVSLYDNLQPEQAKIYIINYKRKDTNVINFYQFGTATVDVLIDVRVANNIKDLAVANNKQDLKIRTTQELLELDTFADDLCSKDPKQLCQLYMRLENLEKAEVDITLTHLVQDSIIELKDGIWQSFPLSVTTSSTHFYFAPKHQNKSITVLYNTTYFKLQLSYKLWKNKDEHFDPSKWPFPEEQNSTELAQFSPLRHISISPEPLKDCWPDCVILFTLLGIDRANITNITAWDDKRVNDSFSIMASNDVIELMEHEKIDLILHEKEEKELYIDLKYFLEKERLTFFTKSALGSVTMFGSVSSSKTLRRPSNSEYDFTFGYVETQIPVSKIKSKMEELSMMGDLEHFLRIVLYPVQTTKMSIEFTSKQDMIKQLHYETSESMQIDKGQERMFQLVPVLDYRIRLIRVKGFPYLEWKECDSVELEKCIDTMTNYVQLSSKTDMIEGKRATNKIVVVKVQAKELIELELYTQSPNGELELTEGKTITDFCDKGEKNKYTMTSHKQQETVITINVLEGNPTVKAWTNYQQKPFVKTKKDSSIIHIAIPPHKDRNETSPPANMFMNRFDSFGLNSILETIHLEISDNDTNAYYTVSYTSGQRGLELEDGLITSTLIESNRSVTFFYDNSHREMSLVATISFPTVGQLQSASIKISYGNEDKNFEEQNPETPEVKKKTPHPTMVFKLPTGYNYYEILITNSGKENSSVSVMVNQDEIIMLPYQVEYPVVLKAAEKQHLLVEVSNEGFLLLVVRKCDEGVPTLSYSFDYNATLKDEYEYESPIKDEVRQQIFIKPRIGTLYIKFTVDVDSVFSVMVQYYHSKGDMPRDSAKLGNQGIIEYQLINSIDAEISFVPLNCNGKPCPKAKYEYLSSTNLQNLYSQLVCPSNFFTFTETMPPLHPTSISVSGNMTEPTRFEYRLLDQISYFGIRVMLDNGREYIYKPIEIVTIWGHISRNKRYHSFAITLFLGCVVICICMLLRRRQRRGYGQLKEEEDPSDHDATRLRPL